VAVKENLLKELKAVLLSAHEKCFEEWAFFIKALARNEGVQRTRAILKGTK